jgi:hypothetical protein
LVHGKQFLLSIDDKTHKQQTPMKTIANFSAPILFITYLLMPACTSQPVLPVPSLEKRGNATQLIVDGKPFLVLGGELHNSSSSSREYMKEYWPKLKESGMNTVLAAVEWALVEPVEGTFDFTVVDNLVEDARRNDLRLILLWFGAWKNGQSHYTPGWVKKDYVRFPRVKAENGKSLEILSIFGSDLLQADSRAFAALMKHVGEIDSQLRTVIMMQVQNEVGILGSPRDHGPKADEAFYSAVPQELMNYLSANNENLLPETSELWSASDNKTSGTWEEVFGKSEKCDEIFMAWHYARFLNENTKAGKAEYPLPMLVNAWLVQISDKRPGDYPSGGPQAHMLDIWRAGAPDVDLYCPDIYRPVFSELCELYTRNNNVLFIPEARAGVQGAGQFFYAVGKHNSIGYSPFGFEARTNDVENDPMTRAYKVAGNMADIILEAQEKGNITAVLMEGDTNPSKEVILGGYKFSVEPGRNRREDSDPASQGYGLIINIAPDEFIIYGSEIQVSFSPATDGPAIAGIAQVDEGTYNNGKWIPGRRLNGDDIMLDYDLAKKALENKTGTGLRFGREDAKVQRVKLYRYE